MENGFYYGPSDVQSILKYILSSVKGEDVRGAIHDAIKQCYYDGKAGGNDLEARDRAAAAEARIALLEAGRETGITADEVRAIRVALDGTTYTSAAERLEEEFYKTRTIEVSKTEPTRRNTALWINPTNTDTFEVPEIKDDETSDVDTWSSKKIKHEFDKLSYLIDLDIHWTEGGFIRHADGGQTNHSQYKYTNYVKRPSGATIYYRCEFGTGAGIAIYDDNYNFIRGINNPYGSNPDGTAINYVMEGEISDGTYVRFSTLIPAATEASEYKDADIYMNMLTGDNTAHCNYEGDEICVFNKILCVGDSLTSGTFNHIQNGSDKYIEDAKYSFPTYLTKMTGVETKNVGSGGSTSDEWYAKYANADLSGYDAAIIQLGVNDYYRYSGWTDASIRGFTNTINKLTTENPNIKIFVSTIIPAISYPKNTFATISNGIRALVSDLNDPNIILLDMAEYGHTANLMGYNCGHLSALGYWRLAKDYKAYISYYISQNPSEFREVQFIGTEYVYEV